MAAQPGPFARLRFSVGCCWATITIAFVLIVSVHAALLYTFATGLGPKFSRIIVGPLVARVIERAPPPRLPPPPPPQLSSTHIELPPMEHLPPIESDPTDVVAKTPREPAHPALPPSAQPALVNRVQGGPGIGFLSTADFYPDASIRMEEKGVATVKACVDAKGHLTSEPVIVDSSGSPRLDAAALRLAKAGSGHYRATAEDSRAVNSCYPFRIRFALHD